MNNFIQSKIDAIFNCKTEDEIRKTIIELIQEDPEEIKKIFRGYYDQVINYFYDLQINNGTKKILFNLLFDVLDTDYLIGAILSKSKKSETKKDYLDTILLFNLLIKEDYITELKGLIHEAYNQTIINSTNFDEHDLLEIERAYLSVLGSLGDRKSEEILRNVVMEVIKKETNYEKRFGLYDALEKIDIPSKSDIYEKLYSRCDNIREKRYIIRNSLSDDFTDSTGILIFLDKIKDEELDQELKKMIEDKRRKITSLVKPRKIKNFQDLSIKSAYDSDEDNILDDFLIPLLDNAIEYNRLTGTFSSSSLMITARGIAGLINNNGKMKLLANSRLYKHDIEAIQAGEELAQEKLDKLIADEFLAELEEIEEEIVKDHIAALGWLIATQQLEFKIIIMEDPTKTMFHQKIGILKDKEGNVVTFSGSVNESLTGWSGNIEEFKVYRNWIIGQTEYVQSDILKFQKFWENRAKKAVIMDIPSAVKEKLISFSPKSADEIKKRLNKWYKKFTRTDAQKLEDIFGWIYDFENNIPLIENQVNYLRKCQEDAIDYLKQRGYSGILSMATGTGKTLAAIHAAYHVWLIQEKKKPLLIIVSVPDKYLVAQWKKSLRKYTKNILEVHSGIPGWKKRIKGIITTLNHRKSHFFIIGTNKSLGRDIYRRLDEEYFFEDQNILFIGDEMHSLGAPTSQYNLKLFTPNYRIGLSATPQRYYDQEGTKFLMNWFSVRTEKDIFYYSLGDAQRKGYLVEYYYCAISCVLNEEEFQKFSSINKRIKNLSRSIKEEEEDIQKLESIENLSMKRALVLKKCNSKIEGLNDLIDDIITEDKLKNLAIFAEDNEQVNLIKDLISRKIKRKEDIRFAVFDGEKSLKERESIIQDSVSGNIDIILAMRCLDQGVDIPSLTRSIFLSSAASPLEHIQRAGRILRNGKKKKEPAEIFDFFVTLTSSQMQGDYDSCLKIKEIEQKRGFFFCENALNGFKMQIEIEELYKGVS